MGNCVTTSQHSWAWISPDGVFHDAGGNHARWAINYPGVRERVIARMRKDNRLDDLISPSRFQGYDGQSDSTPLRVSHAYYKDMLEALNEASFKDDPPPSHVKEADGLEAWDVVRECYDSYWQTLSKDVLMGDGWWRIANPNNLEVSDADDVDAWDTFFEHSYECLKGVRNLPDLDFYAYKDGRRLPPRTWGDALERYASGEVASMLFDHLINKVTRRIASARCKGLDDHSWAWISPAGDFHEVSDHATWAYNYQGMRERVVQRVFKEEKLETLRSPQGYKDGSRIIKVSSDFYLKMMAELAKIPPLRSEDPLPNLPLHSEEEDTALSAWEIVVDAFRYAWRDWSLNIFLEDGWLHASNPNTVQVYDPNGADPAVWDTFFRMSYECLKDGPVVAELRFNGYQKRQSLPPRSWGEALEKYASKDVSEEIFEDLFAKASKRNRMKAGSECVGVGDHSWAWISPDGRFYKIDTMHKTWALEYPGVRSKVVDALRKHNGWDDLISPVGLDVGAHSNATVPPKIYHEMLEALRNDSVWSHPNPKEQLKFWLVWRTLNNQFFTAGGLWAQITLIKDGWMKVSNPITVSVSDVNNTDQWDTFFKRSYECLKYKKNVSDFYFYGYEDDLRLPTKMWGEALETYASRDVSEEIFEDMLAQANKRMASASYCVSTIDHSWGWISPEGRFYDIDPESSHNSWAFNYPALRPKIIEKLRKDHKWDDLSSPGEPRLQFLTSSLWMKSEIYQAMLQAIREGTKWSARDPKEESEFMPVWRYLVSDYDKNGWEISSDVLLEEGWMKASNPITASAKNINNRDQWDTFFRRAYECIKHDPHPTQKAFFGYKDGGRIPQKLWGAALDKYVSREVVEEIYNDLLQRAEKRLASSRAVSATPCGPHPNY